MYTWDALNSRSSALYYLSLDFENVNAFCSGEDSTVTANISTIRQTVVPVDVLDNNFPPGCCYIRLISFHLFLSPTGTRFCRSLVRITMSTRGFLKAGDVLLDTALISRVNVTKNPS